MPYIFVGASVTAVIPIIILFKVFIERLRENPDNEGKLFIQYFIGIAIAEFIPIVLVVIGMVNVSPVADISELYFPGALIILVTGAAIFFVLLQQFGDLRVNTMMYRIISMGLIGGIPIVSLVGLMTMIPS